MLVGRNKLRQSGAREIQLTNAGGVRTVKFPDLLSYRLLFRENGSIKKNVS